MAEETVDSRTGARYGAAGRSAADTAESFGRTEPAGASPAASPGAAFAEVGERLGEAWQFIGYYVQAQVDRLRLTVRRAMLLAALGLLGLVAGGAVLATAGVLICVGIAHLIGYLTGWYWLGDLLTGLLILGAVAGAVYWAIGHITRTSRSATVAEYERRLREQREHYGTDVNERAQRD